MSPFVDSVSLISNVFAATQGTAVSQRQMAVAANAVRTEQETVATLLEALQQSTAYSASGQLSSGAVAGAKFSAVA